MPGIVLNAPDATLCDSLRPKRHSGRAARAAANASKRQPWHSRRCSNVRCPQTEEVAVSESTQDQPDQPDQADEQAPKPGEQDTETVAGNPKKAPESRAREVQSKQDQ
jgi:hypothetical protein